ncbi:MAG TPA: ATP-binding protein [Gemmatimonadales bacterium]
MDMTLTCPLAAHLAALIRGSSNELAERWLERIAARVTLEPDRIFPTEELLDHVPLLMEGIADYVEDPSRELRGQIPVIGKAMELGELRFSQGFDAYQILKEYEVLGGILFTYLASEVDTIDEECTRAELLVCAHRVYRAIAVIQQATTTQYLEHAAAQVRKREDRLRSFDRALTHEFKNQLHAATGAVQMLQMEEVAESDRKRLRAVISRNLEEMRTRLDALLDLTRLEYDSRRQRGVLLPRAAAEAARVLRERAAARGVEIRLADDMPAVEVHAAAVELCLSNYLSNAIKYSDQSRPERWAEVRARFADSPEHGRELVVEVADNGLGVPEDARSRLFGRFVRAHETVTGVEGTGLGLSIVEDTVKALGGRVWACFPDEGGSIFAFALPWRRGAGE